MNRLTLALVAAIAASAGHAMEKPYVGIDYQIQTYSVKTVDINPEAVRLRLGTDVNRYIGVEAQIGVGTAADTLTTGGVSYDVKTDSYYALFLKPQISIGDSGSLYGLVGGSYVDVSSSGGKGSQQGFTSEFAFGAGVDVAVHKGIRIGVEFTQYLEDLSAVSAGIRIPLN